MRRTSNTRGHHNPAYEDPMSTRVYEEIEELQFRILIPIISYHKHCMHLIKDGGELIVKLYNKLSYARVLIGSHLRSIEGQTYR